MRDSAPLSSSGSRLPPRATRPRGRAYVMTAAIFNLNHPAHTVHWHFLTMSVSNLVVIVLMLAVFVLAVLVPFPGTARKEHPR